MGCEISTIGGGSTGSIGRVAVDASFVTQRDSDIDNEGNDAKLNDKIGKFNTVLKDSLARDKLRRFILNTWVPIRSKAFSQSHVCLYICNLNLCYYIFIGKDSSDLFKSEATTIAINFFDFWLDSGDYSELPKSAFQSYRACFIFEKYLMHGASHNVSITTNVIDECSQTLFGRYSI